MFIASLPTPLVQQVPRVFPFEHFKEFYVCCSGNFRLEQMLAQVGGPGLVVSNDVNLVTCALGRLAATGAAPPFTFIDKLAFVEGELGGAKDRVRVAALLVAGEMAKYVGNNAWAETHFAHYQTHFAHYLAKATAKVDKLLAAIRIARFETRDFREHAREGIARGAAILAFPPPQKGGYEKLYQFLHTNVRWEAPEYGVFDPKLAEAWVLELDEAEARYCVLTDQRFPSIEPVGALDTTSNKAMFIYANGGHASYTRLDYVIKPFKYTIVEAADIKPDSLVQIIPADAGMMNFLKERYLAKSIAHTAGHVNFIVFVDGKLAGGFIYTRAKHDPTKTLYLLSDFSVSRERRISKLIALLASCKLAINVAELRLLISVQSLVTTAFTERAVSMKYRGIYELTGRGPGHLQYASKVRNQSPQEIYSEWFAKHATASA